MTDQYFKLNTVCRSIALMLVATVYCDLLMANPLDLQGSLQQGGLVVGRVPAGHSVVYQGNLLKLSPNGQFLLGFGRDAPAQVELTIVSSNSQQQIETLSIAKRDYSIQRVDGVPQKTVTPSEADLERIRNDAALVKAARSQVSDSLDFLGGFDEPSIGPITGVYGSQRVYNGIPKSPHYGIDYGSHRYYCQSAGGGCGQACQ